MDTTQLVVIGDVSGFINRPQITHDSDFIQVTIAGNAYARAIRHRTGRAAEIYGAGVAKHVEEVASLVSQPSLIDWLIDSGFVRVQ